MTVQKPFQWFDTFKSDLGHLTPRLTMKMRVQKQLYQLEVESNQSESLKMKMKQLMSVAGYEVKIAGHKNHSSRCDYESKVSGNKS